jgi:integrase
MAGNKKGRRRRFGSVRQLPSGRHQARYRGPDGLMHAAPGTFATQTDAEVWLSVKEAEIVQGDWMDPNAGRVPLGEYATTWIAERPGLSERTTVLYRTLLRLHIESKLGGLDLVDLTPARVRSWRKDLLDGGVGEATVAKSYRLLRAVMNTALDDELIRRNPCRIKGGGRELTPERPVATVDQVFAIVDAMPARWRALVVLAVGGSLRWGELMGLRRTDVDLAAGTVSVVRSIAEVGGRLVEKRPKSAAGRRTVAIPMAIVPTLRAHLDVFAQKGQNGRVFVGPAGATPRRGNFNRTWQKAIKKAKMPAGFRFHDLRHTGNTWVAGSGASLRELMARMGHSSARAALIYQHATSERDRALADGLDRLLGERDGDDAQGDEQEGEAEPA